MKKLANALPILIASLLVTVVVSCTLKGPHTNPEVKFEATMSGAKEIPAVSGGGNGKFEATYNKDTKTLSYTLTFSGLSGAPTAAHLHNASAWENGPAVLPLSTPSGSSYSGSLTLSQAQENELFVGRMYANVHTILNKGGEIRGQVEFSEYLRSQGK
jgi:CHRD domain